MEEENLPLENKWSFWFDKGQKSRSGGGKDQYLERLKNIGVFDNVVEFWKHFNFLRVEDMRDGSNLMLFKAGLDPVWEHPGNIKGGKFVIPLTGADVPKVWEASVLQAIGESYSMSDSVCGARGDSLCIWNNDCERKDDIERMRGELVASLGLGDVVRPEQVVYQPHKGHIDFNQQHAPPPPEARKSGRKSIDATKRQSGDAKRSSARNSGGPPVAAAVAPAEVVAQTAAVSVSAASATTAAVSYAQMLKGAKPAAAKQTTTTTTTTTTTPAPAATASAAAAATSAVVVAAVAPPRVVVTASMDTESVAVAVEAREPPAAAPASPSSDAHRPRSPPSTPDKKDAKSPGRGNARSKSPAVLVTRRPSTPAPVDALPAAPAVAAEAAKPAGKGGKKGRSSGARGAAKSGGSATTTSATSAATTTKTTTSSGRASATTRSAAVAVAAPSADAWLVPVTVAGVLVALLSLWWAVGR